MLKIRNIGLKSIILWIVLITPFFFIRYKYLYSAIETDVGAHAYGAQELLRGNWPYIDFFENRSPGIFIIFALIISILGQTTQAIKLFTSLIVLFNGLLVGLISRKYFSKRLAIANVFVYLYSMSLPYIQGSFANAEVFTSFFILVSIWLMVSNRTIIRWFIAGIFMGLALLTKTSAIASWLAIIIWLLIFRDKNFFKYLAVFFGGTAIPWLIVILQYCIKGGLNDLYFANFIYVKEYIQQTPIIARITKFPILILIENPGLWILGFIGLVLVLLRKFNSHHRQILYLISLNLVVTFFIIQLAGYAWPHYYIQILPFMSTLCLLAYIYFNTKINNKIFIFTLIICSLVFPIVTLIKVISTPSYRLLTFIQPLGWGIGRGDWYDQSVYLANYLKRYVKPGDYIYNLGRESQLYFYTQTRSSSRIYHDRPLYLFPELIEEVCQDLADNKPKLIVNTIQLPHFKPEIGSILWNHLRKCGNLTIQKKEKYLFSEIWFLN